MKDDSTQQKSAAAWRSSRALIIFTATLGLFTENFLYGFIVPIIKYMLEDRLGLDPKYTQRYNSALLFILGAVAVFAAPFIGHYLDQIPGRKIPLLVSLVICTVGTVLVAATPALWVVFLGRVLQSISGTAAWIACFGMLSDAAGTKHIGKALGLASSFTTTGVILGPAVAGAAVQWFGYWAAWSVPLVLIAIDFIARLVIDEKPKEVAKETDADEEATEDAPLLPENAGIPEGPPALKGPDGTSARGFYRIMLTDARVLIALLNTIVFAIIVAGFDATVPLHLATVYGWGTAPIGAIFFCIMVPGMFIAPFVGWMRDHIGLKYPTALGWLLQAPLMWFLGVPGALDLPGLRTHRQWDAAFISCMVAIGVVSPLVRGAGTFQLTASMNEMKAKDPLVFGPHGGTSRLFSLTEIFWNGGLMIGPVLAGGLRDTVGFYWMSVALAIICVVTSILSFIFLTHRTKTEVDLETETEESCLV